MHMARILLLAGLVALAAGCGTVPNSKLNHITANKEFNARLQEAATLLSVMKDGPSAKRKLEDFQGVTRRIQELQAEFKALGPTPKSQEEEVGKLLVEQRKARERLNAELTRVNGLPEAVTALGDSLTVLNRLEN
jgi:galactokinase